MYKHDDFEISVNGTLGGSIWWPHGLMVYKDIHHRIDFKIYTSRPTLRDVVLKITNDGDFENCDLLGNAYVEVILHTKTHVITRVFDIGLFESVKDCVLLDEFPEIVE